MKNEKLITFMHTKGVTRAQLSVLSGISATTLNRIINGQILHVKTAQMQAIARALGTDIHSVFDNAPVQLPLPLAIRPDQAGSSFTKMLSPDESLLLYWYQNALEDGRDTILNRARMEFHKAQLEIYHRADGIKNAKKISESYEQLSLDFSAEKIN
ncbi:MAG: helix-turn-helix transcriptional regulator [Hungatella sp.]|jgi:transcriptional regulator with XRE-family HTH domain|nr:helix-turn-helix transcriptional regulator [Hungatella sp.]